MNEKKYFEQISRRFKFKYRLQKLLEEQKINEIAMCMKFAEEYTSKLDMKTLQAALKVIKIQQSVAHKDTYDLFIEALTVATAIPE